MASDRCRAPLPPRSSLLSESGINVCRVAFDVTTKHSRNLVVTKCAARFQSGVLTTHCLKLLLFLQSSVPYSIIIIKPLPVTDRTTGDRSRYTRTLKKTRWPLTNVLVADRD
ncbi:uncharacterized [Tachysurus ichikawai]